MSGKEFVSALKRIGYPNVDRLDEHSFDWLFDCEALVPFLTWFCNDLQSSNVLDQKDQDEYRSLDSVQSKSSLLSGTELEDALHRWSLIDDACSVDTTLTGTELVRLKNELSLCRQRRDELKTLHDKLALYHTTLADRLGRLDAVIKSTHSNYQHSVEQVRLSNTNLNKTLQSLLLSVSELLTIYKSMSQQHSERSTEDKDVLISYSNMDDYHAAEERFTQQLVGFTKKQFFDGIGEIAGNSEGSEYELVEISNADLLLVKGSSEDVILEACKDLTHIQSLYPVSEAKRIDALIEERSTTSACEFQERMTRVLKDNPYPQDQLSLSSKLKDVQTSLVAVNRDMLNLTDTKIPKQIKEAASLQAVKVLGGDYDLKIARQDYFTANQDQVIDHLVTQRSRNEFLTMALELESRGHRDVHKLLTAITILLQKMYTSFNNRMTMMVELDEAAARTNRTTVDSRDTFLHSVHQLIAHDTFEDDLHKKKSLFVTYSQMEQNANLFAHHMSALQASLSTANQTEHDRLMSLDQEMTKCDSVLYADCSTVGGQPSLSPRPILETMTQLDSLLKKLEQVVMDVIKDIDNKKKVLKKDALLNSERDLFGFFFNDPSRLRQSVDELELRLKAHSVV